MKHQTGITESNKWPRVWGVEDPSIVDLSDEFTAIELFVDNPEDNFHHIFRFMVETPLGDACVVTEGILLGRSSTSERPTIAQWAGTDPDLQILSCINLGSGLFRKVIDETSDEVIDGHINDDPIVFLNFDPATTTARFMSSLDCVPEPVRARHLESHQGFAKAASH